MVAYANLLPIISTTIVNVSQASGENTAKKTKDPVSPATPVKMAARAKTTVVSPTLVNVHLDLLANTAKKMFVYRIHAKMGARAIRGRASTTGALVNLDSREKAARRWWIHVSPTLASTEGFVSNPRLCHSVVIVRSDSRDAIVRRNVKRSKLQWMSFFSSTGVGVCTVKSK